MEKLVFAGCAIRINGRIGEARNHQMVHQFAELTVAKSRHTTTFQVFSGIIAQMRARGRWQNARDMGARTGHTTICRTVSAASGAQNIPNSVRAKTCQLHSSACWRGVRNPPGMVSLKAIVQMRARQWKKPRPSCRRQAVIGGPTASSSETPAAIAPRRRNCKQATPFPFTRR